MIAKRRRLGIVPTGTRMASNRCGRRGRGRCPVVKPGVRRVGLDALGLDVFGLDQEDLGLMEIESDHGKGRIVRHGALR
jgi:hypothetical protein